jgi:predicted TIM-barrel fold metal-dependent hydrolase
MKPDKEPMALDRRRLMLAAAGGAMAAAAPAALAAPAMDPVFDAHLHLFNGSDLPVGKFLRYVYLPDQFPALPPWLDALADLGVNVIKKLATTVRQEAGQQTFVASLNGGSEVTPERFGQVVGDYVAEGSRSPAAALKGGGAPFDPALAASYRALVQEVSGGSTNWLQQFKIDPQTNLLDLQVDDRAALRNVFTLVAKAADRPSPHLDQNLDFTNPLSILSDGARTLGWLYLMCKSRQSHIDRYLGDYRTATAQPKLVINHLVDYDRWLDDRPSDDSPHLEQVALLATLAKRNKGKVDLRTFAGFCPLKNVFEKALNPGKPTTLTALQKAFTDGQIAGFKIYPPMGFQAYGNALLKDAKFARPAGADEVVLKQWKAVSPGSVGKDLLGAALDASLHDFYGWCEANNAPLMTHGGPGNQAAPGFGARANPKYWEAAQKLHPRLRLNIGHVVHDVPAFVTAVETGTVDPDKVWALDATIRMLSAGPTGTIYGDLAYMPELIDDATLRTRFFKALKKAFGPVDPGLRHILYGTDWILLGLRKDNTNFLGAMIQGMTDAGYSPDEKTNILYANARRFLQI